MYTSVRSSVTARMLNTHMHVRGITDPHRKGSIERNRQILQLTRAGMAKKHENKLTAVHAIHHPARLDQKGDSKQVPVACCGVDTKEESKRFIAAGRTSQTG